ncbi:hypothetical protein FDW83_07580 [Pseudarthrobacter sp. NamE2]|uniref:hypothetical protein n=1 Tax=Pseudarthrobacter sp. NamE2 TaxID=2576838 RepID=UPI0010FECF5C|nr:hypothetical protein [Pseudarthrobacter sp. NamE2]TLM84565.1 hypothetical protein FDW83_07580 [Pseudarthrobacter sp. NamE2]
MRDLRHVARELLRAKAVALIGLWILYWNNGGRYDPFEFDAVIYEALPASCFDFEPLDVALDELIMKWLMEGITAWPDATRRCLG